MKKKRDGWCAFGLRRAGLALCFLILLLGLAVMASAQSKAQQAPAASQAAPTPDQTPTTPATMAGIIASYVPFGFTVEGPRTVVSVDLNSLSLFSGQDNRPIVVNVQGMQVSVRDENNAPLSWSALRAGTLVYLCRQASSNQLFIFAVPREGRPNDI